MTRTRSWEPGLLSDLAGLGGPVGAEEDATGVVEPEGLRNRRLTARAWNIRCTSAVPMGVEERRARLATLPPGVTASPRRRAVTERLHAFPPVPPAEPAAIRPPRPAVVVPPPVSIPATRAGATAPARWAAGTVPPPVLDRPLPSLLDVVARVRAEAAQRVLVPRLSPPATADDDVEEIVVDLDDDEMLLSETDVMMLE